MAIQRLRFEHPEVGAVVLTSGKERVFCAGANIRMLSQSSHGWKVNFCKFTNETRSAIEEPYHPFTVNIVDREHPITQGLPASFAQNDELYHLLSLQPNIHVLAGAFDDPKNCYKPNEGCGTGKDEPLIWTLPYGMGRVFQTALGHDAKPMPSPGFVITLLRGTEWAATGAVTIPVPAELK